MLNQIARYLFCFALTGLLIGQDRAQQTTSTQGPDLSAMDQSADPCQNFDQYACGGWRKAHPIPSDESRWSRFSELNERNEVILRTILEDSAQQQNRSSVDQKIGGFYASCMNEPEIEQRGRKPLLEELARIAHIGTPHDLLVETARLQQRQVDVFFTFTSAPDLKDAKMNIANLDQGGLGLPEKDYYFRSDPKSVEIRQKYVAAIAKMFRLAGDDSPTATKKATVVMSIETALAKASLDITTRRDPQRLFHQIARPEIARWSPHFDFEQFFAAAGAPAFTKLNVSVPDYIKGLNSLLTSRPLTDFHDYLAWHYLHASAPLLSRSFVDENFAFYSQTLQGTKQLKPRWKRCVAATDDELGEALGRKFVEKTFGQEGKQRTLRMVREIEQEMASDLESLSWMSAETKQQALVKLRAVTNKIGYPDRWRDYSSIEILPDDYFGNSYRSNEFEYRRELDKIGKPVDRNEWLMTPPTVNAYYDPTQNNINFPAGILQPPFYSNTAADAVNYGAIGAVIGHELTHGFDDEGRQFDADGNLKDWWSKADGQQFEKLASCTVNEYGGFSPITGIELNGKLTLGENTADNGGARLAYMALLEDLARKSIPPSEKVNGYTQAQQFFLGYAQDWCEAATPEMSRLLAHVDPHSPGKFRTNGVLKNMSEFSEAFGCKATDAMYVAKGKGCRVW